MAEYEVVREVQNLCGNNQMRDVFFGPETDDHVGWVRGLIEAGQVADRRRRRTRIDRLYVASAAAADRPHDEALTRRCSGHAKNGKRNAFFHIFACCRTCNCQPSVIRYFCIESMPARELRFTVRTQQVDHIISSQPPSSSRRVAAGVAVEAAVVVGGGRGHAQDALKKVSTPAAWACARDSHAIAVKTHGLPR